MKSARAYLLSRLVLGSSAILLVAAGVIGMVVVRSLERQFDQNLTDRVQGFASILFQTEDGLQFEFSDELMPEYGAEIRPAYFQIEVVGEGLLERSNSLGDGVLTCPRPVVRSPRHWTAPLPDGRQGRFVSERITIHHVFPEQGPGRPQAKEVEVLLARGRETLRAAELRVLLGCAATVILVVGLLALLCRETIERGLAPAHRLAAAMDAIRVDALPSSFEPGPLPVELEPIARTTGSLIRRVQKALDREKRTTADISHELRTPISELLTVSEVALRMDADLEASHEALGNIRDTAWRMSRSVNTLLKLARLEAGSEPCEQRAVVLGRVLEETLRSLGQVVRERELCIESQVPVQTTVVGDEEVLRIIVSNLLSNAALHTPRGGTVTLRAEGGPSWWWSVENEAPDLEPEELESLVEPFWRKDPARSGGRHFGLGLALSHSLASRSGLRLAFVLEDQRFRATLANETKAGGHPQAG